MGGVFLRITGAALGLAREAEALDRPRRPNVSLPRALATRSLAGLRIARLHHCRGFGDRMGQIFISYRHVEPDESLARALVVALDARRHPVFIDARIEVGTRWVAEIERQIRASAYFVVVLSEHSIRSDMVRQEVALAHELEEDGRMRILPIRAGFDGALPYDLASYLNPIQYAFWRPGSPFDEICGQIVAAVDKAAALPLTTPAGEDSSVLDGESVPDGPAPLPSADPRIVMETGTVRLSSPFYVVRRSDELMERALGRDEGATLVVKGVRQSGKSSLLARAHALSHKLGRRSIYVDFQQLDSRHLESLGSLMRNLAARIARELRTDVKPGDVWDDDLGDKESFADFIESAVLAAEEEPVLLCLDEVDRLFDRPYRADFFAAVAAGTTTGRSHRSGTACTWRSPTPPTLPCGSTTSTSRRSTSASGCVSKISRSPRSATWRNATASGWPGWRSSTVYTVW